MSDILTGKYKAAPIKIQTGNVKTARLTIGRLIKARAQNQIDRETYKDLLYGFTVFLTYKKHEVEITDLAEIKELIREGKK